MAEEVRQYEEIRSRLSNLERSWCLLPHLDELISIVFIPQLVHEKVLKITDRNVPNAKAKHGRLRGGRLRRSRCPFLIPQERGRNIRLTSARVVSRGRPRLIDQPTKRNHIMGQSQLVGSS